MEILDGCTLGRFAFSSVFHFSSIDNEYSEMMKCFFVRPILHACLLLSSLFRVLIDYSSVTKSLNPFSYFE